MKVLFFCPMWGLADMPVPQMLHKIKNAGYDGIEFGFTPDYMHKEEFIELAAALGLLIIGQQCFAVGSDFKAYRSSFRKNIEWLISFNPLLINSHTGRDFYNFNQNRELIQIAAEAELASGVKILHETHRGRFAFHPLQCIQYLDGFPGLGFTADFSHFCTVCESYLEDQALALSQIRERCFHIHARVGHPQGPQVIDPRLPEYSAALQVHLNWWDNIFEIRKNSNAATLSITPEFGPVPYMPASPFTGQPLASQWEINHYMMQFLRRRYNDN
ncbi:TIM barrel protein [Mucilaginibacter sabulilitoris]|uniref:TIM barrel protein n=1 Tax=Mucilaginibacter sabulilitoris TaxID=1173583 RepID=A0ABZ0TJH9_9SPHI|nr:TIM barrel protein [Mucilaginibacter sabulilitoris]WPU92841.1 TIM barrel protein [Mucilaginibacter sabulilitoris]